MKKTIKIIDQMKALKAGELVFVEYCPDEPMWWIACPKCGSVQNDIPSRITVKDGKVNSESLWCSSCGGCNFDYKIVNNKVVEL